MNVFSFFEKNINGPWVDPSKSEEQNFRDLIAILERSSRGKFLLNKAYEKTAEIGKSIYDVLRLGDGSITDTTLLRRFNPDDPFHVAYDSRALIFLNKNLSVYHAVLDFAHELVHFIARKDFNPYTHDFTVVDFVKNTIEGTGGEAEAFLGECQVNLEIFSHDSSERSRCKRVFKISETKESAVKEFYKLGPYYRNFKDSILEIAPFLDIESEFPHLSRSKVVFQSSAHYKPYPLASVDEFKNIQKAACKNEKRRLDLALLSMRGPSSENSTKKKMFSSLKHDFEGRCFSFVQ